MKCVVARSALYTGQAIHPPSVYSADPGHRAGACYWADTQTVDKMRSQYMGGREDSLALSAPFTGHPPTGVNIFSQQDLSIVSLGSDCINPIAFILLSKYFKITRTINPLFKDHL